MLENVADTLGLAAADAQDLALLFGLYLAAIAFVLLSYVLAGYVWVERHSVRYMTARGEARVSGFWGEFFLCTACAAVVVVALLFSGVAMAELIIGRAQSG